MTAQRLREQLNATGCYQLTGETTADWETDACAAGIDLIEEEINALLADLCPAAAGEEMLRSWEQLFRPDPAQVDLATLRAMMACRLAQHPGDRRLEDYTRLLPGYGAQGTVDESQGALQVAVGRELGLSRAEIARELDQLLPAHLAWTAVWPDTLNWAVLDAWPRSFAQWDALGLTWNQLDSLTPGDLQPQV